jgi:1-acyl-sn-glycerol-3-phosphate acyltransferase
MLAAIFYDIHWIWIALAVVILGAGLVCAIAWALRAPADTFGIAIMRCLARVYLRVVHGLRRVPDPLPAEGAALLIANHRSGIDPPVLAIHTRRQIRFLMAREYYQCRILNWLYRSLKSIPVNRDGRDLAATKEALRALQSGHVIAIFPEGEIRESGLGAIGARNGIAEVDVKSGAALLALKTGVPVVTAFIDGTPAYDSVFRAFVTPSRSRILFGAPIVLTDAPCRRPSKTQVKEATRIIVDDLLSLQKRLLSNDPSPEDQATKNAEVPMTKANP